MRFARAVFGGGEGGLRTDEDVVVEGEIARRVLHPRRRATRRGPGGGSETAARGEVTRGANVDPGTVSASGVFFQRNGALARSARPFIFAGAESPFHPRRVTPPPPPPRAALSFPRLGARGREGHWRGVMRRSLSVVARRLRGASDASRPPTRVAALADASSAVAILHPWRALARFLAADASARPPTPKITVAYTLSDIDAALRRVFYPDGARDVPPSSVRVVGFDVERRPQRRKGAPPHPTALAQITSPDNDECLLLHLHAAGLPRHPKAPEGTLAKTETLARLLHDPSVVFAGVDVRDDVAAVLADYPCLRRDVPAATETKNERDASGGNPTPDPAPDPRHVLDPRVVHVFYNPEEDPESAPGVRRLAASFGFDVEKDPATQRGDWSAHPLDPRQIAYAADDAVVSLWIARRQHARDAPADVSFADWSSCFVGCSRREDLDARAADVAAGTVPAPETMRAQFRRFVNRRRAADATREAADRFIRIAQTLARHDARGGDQPGAAVVTLREVIRLGLGRPEERDDQDERRDERRGAKTETKTEETIGVGEGTDGTSSRRSDASRANSRPRPRPGRPRPPAPSFTFRKTDEGTFRAEVTAPGLAGTLGAGMGTAKNAARDEAAREALRTLRGWKDGVWTCEEVVRRMLASSSARKLGKLPMGSIRCRRGCHAEDARASLSEAGDVGKRAVPLYEACEVRREREKRGG